MSQDGSGSVVPTWVTDADERRSVVTGIIATWVVGGILSVVAAMTGSVVTAWSEVNAALLDAGLAVDRALASTGDSLLGVERTLVGVMLDVGVGAGVAAPIATALTAVIVIGILGMLVVVAIEIAKAVLPI